MTPSPASAVPDGVPTRRLPILYLGFAHVSLATAAAVVAFAPRSVTGFYYHPLMLGVVHLVTLGWITGSMFGALFIVGPIALGMPLPVRRLDYWSYAFFVIGIVGMVSHFWIEQYSGMAWSAGMVLLAALQVAGRVLVGLGRAKLPRAVAVHIALAFVNLLAAATLGVLIGVERETDVIAGSTLTNVYAHAHLAVIGWASLMVVGVGYRLLPMVLPSALPAGPRLWVTAALIETGVAGLFVMLLMMGPTLSVALVTALGFVGVFGTVRWMHRHRRPPPAALPRPDFGVGHAGQALGSLALAVVLGVVLAATADGVWTARVAVLYGVLGLVGFLSRIVVGFEVRVLPVFEWHTRYAASGFTTRPVSPHEMGSATRRRAVFWLWTAAVPLLAAGLTLEWPGLVGAGGWALLAATVTQTVDTTTVLRTGRMPATQPSRRTGSAPVA